MLDARLWATQISEKLRDALGQRLLFTGLQGSYRRGEAHAGSDIDLVVIIDAMTMRDLRVHRDILSAMPHSDKACGFVGGRAELAAWPRHELFQFSRDTVAIHGELEPLLPDIRREDIAASVTVGASGLYHMACHTFLHGDPAARVEAARGAAKAAFFIVLAAHYLRTGVYAESRGALLPLLGAGDRRILELGSAGEDAADRDLETLIAWSAALLREF